MKKCILVLSLQNMVFIFECNNENIGKCFVQKSNNREIDSKRCILLQNIFKFFVFKCTHMDSHDFGAHDFEDRFEGAKVVAVPP